MAGATAVTKIFRAENPAQENLPFLGSADVGRHVELGVRGDPQQVPAAMALMRSAVTDLGYAYDEK